MNRENNIRKGNYFIGPFYVSSNFFTPAYFKPQVNVFLFYFGLNSILTPYTGPYNYANDEK